VAGNLVTVGSHDLAVRRGYLDSTSTEPRRPVPAVGAEQLEETG
jgi:hypothetical protein